MIWLPRNGQPFFCKIRFYAYYYNVLLRSKIDEENRRNNQFRML